MIPGVGIIWLKLECFSKKCYMPGKIKRIFFFFDNLEGRCSAKEA